MKFYCIFDTNVLIAYFLNNNKNSPIYKLLYDNFIKKNNIIPIINKNILNEYLNVLKRGKFDNKINRSEAISFIGILNNKSISIENVKDYVTLLDKDRKEALKDPKDFIFYNIVVEAKEQINQNDTYLITGNKKHFPIKYFIKSPQEMLNYINEVEEKIEMYTSIFYHVREDAIKKINIKNKDIER